MTVSYQVSLDSPQTHEFAVRLRVRCAAGTLYLDLPAWIPGSYMIRDFARNIRDLQARQDGKTVAVEKTDKQTWRLRVDAGMLQVDYRVYALDQSVRTAYLDDTRAYFNGTSLFLRVRGAESGPHRLQLNRPGFAGAAEWRVATTLPGEALDSSGFGDYRASDYAALIDHPVEIGRFAACGFTLAGIDHRMIFVEAEGADLDRIARDVEPICAEHVAMFGELPVKRYLFQTLATADGYGGLEHRDSTSLICKRSDLPWPGGSGIDKGYRQFLALCSHEYFHLWNVKRIRPHVFAQADLCREAHTELLWAFEGITSYYDELALPRSGVLPRDDYLDILAPSLTRYYRNSGRHRQSVAESSFDAWTKFYKQDESAPNAIVSYYNKGALVAFGLDWLIRRASGDRLSLDDLMRHVWTRYGRTGRGVPERAYEGELATLLLEHGVAHCDGLVGDHSRAEDVVAEFFRRYIYGVEELPLADWLADFGVGLVLRRAGADDDQGGFRAPSAGEAEPRPQLGARLGARDGMARVEQVYAGSAAERAGLTPGDLLLAVEGERCRRENITELMARHPLGSQVRLSLFRRDRLREVMLPVDAGPRDTVDLYWLDEAGLAPGVRQRREAWLASSRGRGHG